MRSSSVAALKTFSLGIRASGTRKLRNYFLLCTSPLVIIALYLDWVRILFYWLILSGNNISIPQVNIASYRVSIEALPIHGLDRNTSGLSYNETTNTLFLAINRPPALAEISLYGELLRYIPLPTADDPEGIANIKNNMFIVADESDNRLHVVNIPDGANIAEIVKVLHLSLDFKNFRNFGFEGISWDGANSQLFLVNEKWPRRVIVASQLSLDSEETQQIPLAKNWESNDWLGIIGSDLASVEVDSKTGNLLLLSEESASIAEYSREGQLLGVLPLWRGIAGLKHKVRQPEGLTIAPDGSIYLVSEPNLFYRFTKLQDISD